MNTNTWKRPGTKPAHHYVGWCERDYPLIDGKHKHPCPFDYWTGYKWLAGYPDKDNGAPVGGMMVVANGNASDQYLRWRKV